jgi:RNA-directed DNA polymerase
MNRRALADGLTHALLSSNWSPTGLVEQVTLALGLSATPRWARVLVRFAIRTWRAPPRDRFSEVSRVVHALLPRLFARYRLGPETRIVHWLIAHEAMRENRWNVPSLETLADLGAWLRLSPGELDWIVDRRGLARCSTVPVDAKLRHYVIRWERKASGGARLLEAPKPRLKSIQRRVLHEILDRIPAHPAAHGFVAGRGVRTFAAPHAAHRVVVRVDLEEFFATITAARVRAVFLAAGYPEMVAWSLASLCTSRVPTSIWRAPGAPPPTEDTQARFRQRRRLFTPHLPQGAPTSPALSNLIAYRLDTRLAAAAADAGALYTRYADDLAFSGDDDFARRAQRFVRLVGVIATEEGFRLNERKTRVMRAGARQQLAGVVVNNHPSVARADVDRLKATLYNCVTHGAASQNRQGHHDFRAHLLGRVAYVAAIDPRRGAKLRALLERITWE